MTILCLLDGAAELPVGKKRRVGRPARSVILSFSCSVDPLWGVSYLIFIYGVLRAKCKYSFSSVRHLTVLRSSRGCSVRPSPSIPTIRSPLPRDITIRQADHQATKQSRLLVMCRSPRRLAGSTSITPNGFARHRLQVIKIPRGIGPSF